MEVKMEKIETNVVKLEVKATAENFNEALNKAFKKNQKKFNVPGFRKGKVPMAIVKKYYGIEALYEDAINLVIDETYPKALSDNNIRPVDYPEIDVLEVGEGKELVYTAKVTVYPEVELGQYKEIEVEKVTYEVSEDEIQKRLTSMQEKNARVETKEEGTVEKGNVAVIDFKGYIDDVAFEGGEGSDYPLEIGSGSFIGDFEDQLVGLTVGESKDVNVTFPENYGKEELNGKAAKFEVKIKALQVKDLPVLDDEFAKEVSEFDTIEEVKEDIKKQISETNADREKREFEEAIINKVVDNAKIDVPEVMINKELESMVKDLETRLQYQGLTLQQYYEFTGNDEEKMKSYMKETAERKVKTDLVLESIAKQENMEATEEELKTKALEVAKMYSAGEDEKMADLILKAQESVLKHDVLVEKTIKLLVENAKVK